MNLLGQVEARHRVTVVSLRALRAAWLVAVVLLPVLVVAPVAGAQVTPRPVPPPLRVVLTPTGFEPSSAAVAVGQTVWFDNESGAERRIAIDGGAVASGPVPDGGRFVVALPAPGQVAVADDAVPTHEATLSVGALGLVGVPDGSASAAIPDLLEPEAVLDPHPDLGVWVGRNRVLVGFSPTATVAQANQALADAGLVVVGGIPGLGVLVTELVGGAAPTDVGAVQAALDSLRAAPGIRAAAFDIVQQTSQSIPAPPDPDPGTVAGEGPYGDWEAAVGSDGTAAGFGPNQHLEAARFPQAWSWMDAVPATERLGLSPDTVVLDRGFDPDHPDLAGHPLAELCHGRPVECIVNPIDPGTGLPDSGHGNAVAGVIGAAFGRGERSQTDQNSRGSVGANPRADLHLVPHLRSLIVDGQDVVGFSSLLHELHLVVEQRSFSFPELFVINLSTGPAWIDDGAAWEARWGTETCGGLEGDDATASVRIACTPDTQDQYLAEFAAMAELARPVGERLLGISSALVTSAGNDGERFCAVRPRPTPCTDFDLIDSANVNVFSRVERTFSSPSGRGSPIVTVEAYEEDGTRSPYANVAPLAAAGRVLAPAVLSDGTDSWAMFEGTSFAAPLVSAALGYLKRLDPSLQPDRAIQLLLDRSAPPASGGGGPRLDVFAAAMATPTAARRLVDVNDLSPEGNQRVLYGDDGSVLGPMEVRGTGDEGEAVWTAPDGRVDLRDLRVVRDAWIHACQQGLGWSCPNPAALELDGGADHPKLDTNLDGCVRGQGVVGCDRHESLYSRLDLNGDGVLSDGAVGVPLQSTGAVAPAGTRTPMSDLDVLASQWGAGASADTGGYAAAQLEGLLRSADVEVRLERLWEQGATRAEVSVFTATELRTLEALPPSSPTQPGWRIVTLPVDPIPELGWNDLAQVRVVADLPGRENPDIFLSPLLDVKVGSDRVVSVCADTFTVTADPELPEPGGSSTVAARLVDCLGRPVVGQQVDFEILEGPDGSSISVVTATTGADGTATTVFAMPIGVTDQATVQARAYPALQGEPQLGFAHLGDGFVETSGLTVYYRSREVLEEYERFATNEWGEGQDDCDGSNDAASSLPCFAAYQTLAYPPEVGVEPGVVMFDREGVINDFGSTEGLEVTDRARVLVGPEADEPDPAEHGFAVPVRTNVVQWEPGNPGATTEEEVFTSVYLYLNPRLDWQEFAQLQLPDATIDQTASQLRLWGLAGVNDDSFYNTIHYTSAQKPDLHPDVPIDNLNGGDGVRGWAHIPTELGFLQRADGTAFPFAKDVDGPLTFQRNPDGTYQPYSYCGRNDRSLDVGPGFWSDTDPLREWGRDPSEQRPDRQPGDRAAPTQDGIARSKLQFVAWVSPDGTPPPPGALDFPACDPVGLDASFTVSGQRAEGQPLTFTPDVGRLGENPELIYEWIFGDGTTSDERAPVHVYEDSGTYIITLLVTDPEGGTGAYSQQIEVANLAPNLVIEGITPRPAGATLEMTIGDFSVVDSLGLEVTIEGSGSFPDQEPTMYEIGTWSIDLGAIDPGTYTVGVTVRDKDGGTTTRGFSLSVGAGTPDTGAGGAASDVVTAPRAPAGGWFGAAGATPADAGDLDASVLDGVAVPAFVMASTSVATGAPVTVRNASRSGGVPVGVVLDAGDGRAPLALGPDAVVAITYLDPVTADLAVDLDGAAATSPLTVTGPSVPPTVAYLGDTSAFVGEPAAVSARVETAGGAPVAGRLVRFTLGAATTAATTDAAGVAAATLVVPGPSGPTTLEVGVEATAAGPGTTTTVAFVVQPNVAPTAEAGGPYTTPVAGDLALAASGSDPDPGDGAGLAFTWDLDRDGEFDDAAGASPLVPAAQVSALVCGGSCTAGQVATIRVQAADPRGATATDEATVTTFSDFGLGISPAAATLVPGSSTSFTVTVSTGNDFASPVALSAPGLPTGVTASFAPSSVTPDGTALLTLAASPSAPATAFPLVVRGEAAGIVRETGGSIDLEFGLVPVCRGEFRGVITDAATGLPVSGVPVGASGATGSLSAADGSYTITNVPLAGDNSPRGHEIVVGDDSSWWRVNRYGTAACSVVTTVDAEVTPVRFGTLEGVVVGATASGVVTGPLAGVLITGISGRSATTGADGRYRFEQVPLDRLNAPRPYGLTAARAGHHSRTLSVTARADDVSSTDFVLYQTCTASVRARVLDADTGLPMEGARVRVGTGSSLTTGADGSVTISGVALAAPDNAATRVTVFAVTPAGTNTASASVSVPLPRCGATTPVDLRLRIPVEAKGTFQATVLDADTGLPIEGASVRLGALWSPTGTAVDGTVSWLVSLGFDVTSRSFSAYATAPGYVQSATQNVTVRAEETTAATFRMSRLRFGAIEGVVTDAVTGAPLADVLVVQGTRADRTDGEGRYRIEQVPLGTNPSVEVTVRAEAPSEAYWGAQTRVTVQADETVTADLALTPVCSAAVVRGRVVNAATGAPIEDARVEMSGASTERTSTDAEGRFAFTDLRVGEQNVPRTAWVIASKTGFVTASKEITLFCGADIVVDFGSPQSAEPAAIEGLVSDGDGNPVPDVFVGSGFGGSAATGSDGRYRIEQVPLAVDGGPRDWVLTFAPPAASGFATVQRTATVTAGQTTTVDVVLTRHETDLAPVAFDQAVTTGTGVPVAVTLTGNDPEGASLVFEVFDGPTHGVLAGVAPALTYTPDGGFTGIDTFTFRVSDGTTWSPAATVTITVAGEPMPPVAVLEGPDELDEGTTATLDATGSNDPDGTIVGWAWDLDEDGAFDDASGAVSELTLLDDEVRTVSVRVTDDDGLTVVAERTITWRNLAPVVTAGDDVVLELPASLDRVGSFADPGDDTFTATVDWGDGAGPQPLALDGTGFDLGRSWIGVGDVTVTVEVCDDDGGCGTASFDVTVVEPAPDPSADLSIVKERQGDLVRGARARYLLAVANAGPDPAAGAVVTDALPVGLTFVAAAGTGWTCTHDAGTVRCESDDELPVGPAGVIALDVDVAADAPGEIGNEAQVAADTPDDDTTDDRSLAVGPVTGPTATSSTTSSTTSTTSTTTGVPSSSTATTAVAVQPAAPAASATTSATTPEVGVGAGAGATVAGPPPSVGAAAAPSPTGSSTVGPLPRTGGTVRPFGVVALALLAAGGLALVAARRARRRA